MYLVIYLKRVILVIKSVAALRRKQIITLTNLVNSQAGIESPNAL